MTAPGPTPYDELERRMIQAEQRLAAFEYHQRICRDTLEDMERQLNDLRFTLNRMLRNETE